MDLNSAERHQLIERLLSSWIDVKINILIQQDIFMARQRKLSPERKAFDTVNSFSQILF